MAIVGRSRSDGCLASLKSGCRSPRTEPMASVPLTLPVAPVAGLRKSLSLWVRRRSRNTFGSRRTESRIDHLVLHPLFVCARECGTCTHSHTAREAQQQRHTNRCPHTHTNTHTHTHTHRYRQHTDRQTHTHTHIHRHALGTHTHTHTHTYAPDTDGRSSASALSMCFTPMRSCCVFERVCDCVCVCAFVFERAFVCARD